MKTAINPFYDKNNPYSQPVFSYNTKALFVHREVSVYEYKDEWHYIYEGVVITMRAGFNADTATRVINELLDGTGMQFCNEQVCNHLKQHGHSPKAYRK